jgi:hypothetical protein
MPNIKAGHPEGCPGPRPFLLLGFRHVRAAPLGGLLESNTEFVLSSRILHLDIAEYSLLRGWVNSVGWSQGVEGKEEAPKLWR